MATTGTTNYNWQKPVFNTELDTWGDKLNTIFDQIDAKMKDALDTAGAAIPAAAPTGAVMDFLRNDAPAGWLDLDGSTIGSATSGAAYANAAAENLFLELWATCDNSVCAVSGGRGGSGAADWAANKTLALINMAGRFRRTVGGSEAAAIGVSQTDAFQGFKVRFLRGDAASGVQHLPADHGDVGSTSYLEMTPIESTYGAPRMANETRPVNIAFRTCIKL